MERLYIMEKIYNTGTVNHTAQDGAGCGNKINYGEGHMAGYYGYSMGSNAKAAYADGKMPLSKWTKTQILGAISGNCDIADTKFGLLQKMTKSELIDKFLFMDSYHHTGKYYNLTAFLGVGFGVVEEMEEEEIAKIISSHKNTIKTEGERKAGRPKLRGKQKKT